uniref:Toll-like receptor 4 n=1 Tax=Cyprinus carpio carpio TaxID=630221 RepID=A0A9J8ADP6_CYPCA
MHGKKPQLHTIQYSYLETLDFSFNVLKHLKTVFPVFFFCECLIKHIENDTFYNVKNLTTLILTGNPITYFGPGCLNSLHNLQRLVLVDVGLSSLMLQMNDLTKLQELRVGTNNIESISLPPFMSTFKEFSLLDLHANNISIIKTDHTAVLREFGRNMTLILSRNPLLYIEPGMVCALFQEVYYYIMEKPSELISVFRCMINTSKHSFHISILQKNYSNAEFGLDLGGIEGFDSLEILDFHQATVVRVGYLSVLSNLKCLRYLDVSYSSITFTNIFSFYGLKNLDVFKIIFNNLTFLEHLDTIVVLHPKTISLYVDKNSITSIPLHVLQSLPTNLLEFDLSSNPVDCSCSQTDFILWIIQNQKVLKNPDKIFCKTFSPSSDFRAKDFDIHSCVHKKRLTIFVSVCFVTVVVLLSFLVYRFQFYLQYCCILLRGYRSPGQQECSYDAFVIFSSYDEVWVMNELMENLENGVPPIQLCLHMRDFQAGKSIASNIIDEGIMGSRKIIVVVSQHFIDSAWCRFEFELAQSRFIMERNANIIIIILEDVEERKTKKVFGLHKHLKKNTYLKWSRDPLSNQILDTPQESYYCHKPIILI